jgi:hypothetical protein
MTMSSIPNSVQGVGLPSSMVSLIYSTGSPSLAFLFEVPGIDV